jgi:phosphoglycerate dehydrogenase-like enzyme
MKVSTTSQEPLKLFRADISPYQAHDFAQREKKALEKIGVIYHDRPDEADVLITNTHTNLHRFSSSFLDGLKLVIHPNSGFDNFTETQITQLNCPFVLGNRIRAKSVATYTLACLYQAIGQIPQTKQWDHSRRWSRRSLELMTVQIFGYGHIGRALEQGLKPFVKELHFYDPYKNLFTDLSHEADVIILASSLNKKHLNFFNSAYFARLKTNAIFINPARGKLVQTGALIDWLKLNPSALAFLDVFEQEPFDLSFFPSNATTTCHIAGVDDGLDERIIQFEQEVIGDFTHLSPSDFNLKWSDDFLHERIVNNQFI